MPCLDRDGLGHRHLEVLRRELGIGRRRWADDGLGHERALLALPLLAAEIFCEYEAKKSSALGTIDGGMFTGTAGNPSGPTLGWTNPAYCAGGGATVPWGIGPGGVGAPATLVYCGVGWDAARRSISARVARF